MTKNALLFLWKNWKTERWELGPQTVLSTAAVRFDLRPPGFEFLSLCQMAPLKKFVPFSGQ